LKEVVDDMMRNIKYFALILGIFSVVSATTVSAQPRTLEQQVFKRLISLPYYGIFDHIGFELNGDTVVLSGKVRSLSTRRDAEAAVKRITGVNNVVNNIVNLPPSPYDDRIRVAALRTLADRGLSRYMWEPNPEIRIVVENGRITLEGYVSNRGDWNLANVITNGIPGVFEVTNNLQVGRELYR
jgi:hyperosmotically inducible periplasmic protein